MKDNLEAVIMFDSDGDAWVMKQCNNCIDCDLFINGSLASDSGLKVFHEGKEYNGSMEVVRATLKPWSHLDSLTGEHDCGIDAVITEFLWGE